MSRNLTEDIDKIIRAAINAVKPEVLFNKKIKCSGDKVSVGGKVITLSKYENIYVIGTGKASAFMAKEIENLLGNKITSGVVVTKYDHSAPCNRIKVLEAGHPVIDENTLTASERICELASKANENDFIIFLLSGGGSSLLEKLPENISLNDLAETTNLLLKSGAGIKEINLVRKHLSLLKGGKLAELIYPAECLTLIISDVIGDPVESIASGPTAPDNSSFQDAEKIIIKYELKPELPESIQLHLQKGIEGKIPETLKKENTVFNKVNNIILGNNNDALRSANSMAEELNYNAVILPKNLQGESRDAAKEFSSLVKGIIDNQPAKKRPACLITGGETTVKVTGNCKGGRNQEFALQCLISMKDYTGDFVVASIGTDGTDGPTNAAGGIIDNYSWEKTKRQNLNPEEFLNKNDSYSLLNQIDGLYFTGPTGTNVMDVVVALIK